MSSKTIWILLALAAAAFLIYWFYFREDEGADDGGQNWNDYLPGFMGGTGTPTQTSVSNGTGTVPSPGPAVTTTSAAPAGPSQVISYAPPVRTALSSVLAAPITSAQAAGISSTTVRAMR